MIWKIFLVTFFICATVVAEKCEVCEQSECPQLTYCSSGHALDVCECCEVCAKIIGEKCDNPSKTKEKLHGNCGEYLRCAEYGPNEGTCVCEEEEPVCGSDGKTYSSICQLLKATGEDHELTLIDRSPCRIGPEIKTAPEDAILPLGSVLSLDCEAVGFPVPTLTWELNRDDGSTIPLPSDNPHVAVQVRGGPENYMVTGWVQIMKITTENSGRYTCIATNAKGESRASAKISYIEEDVNENEL
uniref:IGFBP-related protein 1 n=1 Tax=Jaera hopeana TaxID=2067964 RepID=A0A3G4TEF6_9CRUS|nr:IGFBP-related protein 1 [Jaera hopeana]